MRLFSFAKPYLAYHPASRRSSREFDSGQDPLAGPAILAYLARSCGPRAVTSAGSICAPDDQDASSSVLPWSSNWQVDPPGRFRDGGRGATHPLGGGCAEGAIPVEQVRAD